ncbi:helix-turn-helix domain-containing protein [Tenacibaculum sp. ZS6-P6]|uniref:helix-turn-helix domain-containing protein n=1 Tax=Tenacibaculum sp. ZS6-P6 TaxID=3447503 RepID=UPI003F9C6BDA
MNELINSKSITYKTYGYAATEYLKTKEKRKLNQQFFKDSIYKYLPRIAISPENYSILFDIYILLGNTNKRRKKLEQALRYYLTAETFANKAEDIERMVKIQSNIGLIYQDIGSLNKSVLQLKKALNFLDDHKKSLGEKYYQRRFKTLSNLGNVYNTIYQEKNTNNVYLDSSLNCFRNILNDKNFKLTADKTAKIDLCLGTTYSLRKEYVQATDFFEKALSYFKNKKSQSDLYKTHYNLGVNYFNSGNLNKAKQNLLELFKVKKNDDLDTNLVNAHNYISQIYLEEGNIDSARYYFKKYKKIFTIVSENEQLQKKTTKNLIQFNDLEKRIKKLSNENQNYSIAISFLIALLILSIFLIAKNNKEKKKTRLRLEELLLSVTNKNIEKESNSNITINDKQHQEIIKGLKKIENNLYFLKEEFNLYNAAKKIGTNTTYLSKVIKVYKKMSFSEYTNHLRINHIVKILSTDKKVRAYTTQAIGEIGGYKNAKSFTRIFKKHTGITPYQFIEKINTEV